jgi:hypothetical protein
VKQVKFFTTFSNNGYNVYGKTWIDSFLEKTKNYDNIIAKIYVNNMDMSTLPSTDKIEFVNFDIAIPEHKSWIEFYGNNSTHDDFTKKLGIKFSYKSFAMMDILKQNSDCYAIWLDADCVFTSDNFDNFPESLLNNNFIACQCESGSEHIESGIVIFDTAHIDKNKFLEKFYNFYNIPKQFNDFGQFFDGFIIGRTLIHTNINYIDLNDGYGLIGIQSDPTCTFLNPEIKDRFLHNIGITGKRQYNTWKEFKAADEFQIIHGVNELTTKEKLAEINNNIHKFLIAQSNG